MPSMSVKAKALISGLALVILGGSAAALATTVPPPAHTTSAKARLAILNSRVKHDLSLQATHPKSDVPRPAPVTSGAAPAIPEPARASGVVKKPQTPFSPLEFVVSNAYFGRLGSQWVSVFAGAVPAPSGSPAHAGVWVYVGPVSTGAAAPTKAVGLFLSNSGPTELTIFSRHGLLLTLRDGHGATLTFNLATHKFR
jgi:hypothetical protein